MAHRHTRDDITRANVMYHDAIADDYDGRLEGNHPKVVSRFRALFDRDVLPAAQKIAGDRPVRTLDLGCGTGSLETFLPTQGFDVTGIDASEGMLRRARSRFPAHRFIQGDLYAHPFEEQYDLVMEKAVLHHLRDWEILVDRMADLTRPGGVLFIGNEPNCLSYKALAPLKVLFRRAVNRGRGQAIQSRVSEPNLESLAEYHLFYASGLNPWELERRLLNRGFREVRFYFSLRELLASIEERWRWLRLNDAVPGIILDHFPLSRNFDLVAYK